MLRRLRPCCSYSTWLSQSSSGRLASAKEDDDDDVRDGGEGRGLREDFLLEVDRRLLLSRAGLGASASRSDVEEEQRLRVRLVVAVSLGGSFELLGG
jgi:hypothetical protein